MTTRRSRESGRMIQLLFLFLSPNILSAKLPDNFLSIEADNNLTTNADQNIENHSSEYEIEDIIGVENLIEERFQRIFGHSPEVRGSSRRKFRKHYQSRVKAEPFDPVSWSKEYGRSLAEDEEADDDQAVDDKVADDQVNDDANQAAGDDKLDDKIYDFSENGENEDCAKYLVKFLEGTTDAYDTCQGIQNAYSHASCDESKESYNQKYDLDDYFVNFSEYDCCQALLKHHRSYCEEEKILSNMHLLISGVVLLLCEVAKAVVNRANWKFLPEAAVCILVGTACGIFADLVFDLLPNELEFEEISFDDELFLTVLLPPIIFEAALSVSKFEFKRRRGAILLFSVCGTVISTFTSGTLVHVLSIMVNQKLPFLDSMVFGALISSIDPVAILSVLTSLNMDQKDTIFILIFGESLLNDGIAITVFQTLVNRFDGKTNDGTTSLDEILDALATFLISMFGSIAVAIICGIGAWFYFSYLENYLPPVMEVGSFFLWALIPYYICDGLGWSGIVSIVVVGFFMDIYIAGPKAARHLMPSLPSTPRTPTVVKAESGDDMNYIHMTPTDESFSLAVASADRSLASIQPLQSTERIHLSAVANRHIRFVAHLTAQLSENAIFAYLGLFLFSGKYDWNPVLMTIGVTSCILSRLIMVVVVSTIMYRIYQCRKQTYGQYSSRTAASLRDFRTQCVLVLAGLRGAVSLALVENVPIYNAYTGEGCEFKQVLKGMTSACILFTTFVLGGGAYYILPHLGITSDRSGSSIAGLGTPNVANSRKPQSNGPPNGVVC